MAHMLFGWFPKGGWRAVLRESPNIAEKKEQSDLDHVLQGTCHGRKVDLFVGGVNGWCGPPLGNHPTSPTFQISPPDMIISLDTLSNSGFSGFSAMLGDYLRVG